MSRKTTFTIRSAYPALGPGARADDLVHRRDGREALGQREDGALLDRRGRQRARVGEELLGGQVVRRVRVRDRLVAVASATNVTLVAQVGAQARGGLAALLGADAADRQLADALLGEQLLQVGGGDALWEVLRIWGSPAAGARRPSR